MQKIIISFNKLGEITANTLIPILREELINFSLGFKQLKNYEILMKIIAYSNTEQQNIEITKVKNLRELFMNDAMPNAELEELSSRGIEYLLEISEKKFIPWYSIITVIALGILQIAIGGLLVCTGFGATVGMALITEGISDLVTAVTAISSREFSWEDYLKQKVISLAISAVSCGWSKLKDAGKGIKNICRAAQKKIGEIGTKIITDGKTITNAMKVNEQN